MKLHYKTNITNNIKSNANLKDDKKWHCITTIKRNYIANVYLTKPARTFTCYPKLNLLFEQFQRCSVFNCNRS